MSNENNGTKCNADTEVYSRVCGFFRPVQQWNRGKKEEFKERVEFDVQKSVAPGQFSVEDHTQEVAA